MKYILFLMLFSTTAFAQSVRVPSEGSGKMLMSRTCSDEVMQTEDHEVWKNYQCQFTTISLRIRDGKVLGIFGVSEHYTSNPIIKLCNGFHDTKNIQSINFKKDSVILRYLNHTEECFKSGSDLSDI